MVGWQCSWRSLRDMVTNNTTESGNGDGDWVPPDRLARVRVDAWSRLSKHGDPIRLPALGQPGFGRTCKQVFNLHVGMLDRKHVAAQGQARHYRVGANQWLSR